MKRILYYQLAILCSLSSFYTSHSCPEKCECLDGGRVQCVNKFLQAIPTGIPNDTIHFSVGGNLISRINKNDFANLKSLQTLELYSNQIRVIEIGAFNHLQNLTRLNLNDNSLPSISKETFKGLARLDHLFLSDVAPRDTPLCIEDESFSTMKDLLVLKLDRNELLGLTNLTLSGLENLQQIDLSTNSFQLLSSGAFDGFQSTAVIFNDVLRCCCSTVKALKYVKKYSNVECLDEFNKTSSLKSCTNDLPLCNKIVLNTCSIASPTVISNYSSSPLLSPSVSKTEYSSYEKSMTPSYTVSSVFTTIPSDNVSKTVVDMSTYLVNATGTMTSFSVKLVSRTSDTYESFPSISPTVVTATYRINDSSVFGTMKPQATQSSNSSIYREERSSALSRQLNVSEISDSSKPKVTSIHRSDSNNPISIETAHYSYIDSVEVIDLTVMTSSPHSIHSKSNCLQNSGEARCKTSPRKETKKIAVWLIIVIVCCVFLLFVVLFLIATYCRKKATNYYPNNNHTRLDNGKNNNVHTNGAYQNDATQEVGVTNF